MANSKHAQCSETGTFPSSSFSEHRTMNVKSAGGGAWGVVCAQCVLGDVTDRKKTVVFEWFNAQPHHQTNNKESPGCGCLI